MAVDVVCECGKSYSLKDEYAGKLVKCPQCGVEIEAGASKSIADPAFDRDKFLLRQKHLAISAKYYVWDENKHTIFFVQRPVHFLRNTFAVVVGVISAFLLFFLLGFVLSSAGNSIYGKDIPDAFWVITVPFVTVASILTMLFVTVLLYQKRHITFYRDDSKSERLLEVKQDKTWEIPNATYTLYDSSGDVLARYRKNFIYDIFRKRWYVYNPSSVLWLTAKEDSVIRSVLRRFLGPLFGFLRTNFIILDLQDNIVGEFNRKFTILDRYVLDMSRDKDRTIDRRVALALGVLLDTGERR